MSKAGTSKNMTKVAQGFCEFRTKVGKKMYEILGGAPGGKLFKSAFLQIVYNLSLTGSSRTADFIAFLYMLSSGLVFSSAFFL
jgi:hypothetical protein